ncbi:nitrite reductase small subunit NirD [Gynuella sunshinyii]|uniref:Ferredoxin subunit of nitrite reductase and ring-hydroxylating dioxygenase n=1 Tax=Gynuella sunshinyii YC6258 TaxID=1445510 RepID=A0A0C5VI92_9GAMM|nr:nitrite reductase small subunit NirD [Gynuella sunshinyii]AJQ93986.1 ferredoxin subunit of nitrite reductase and ring-hydroxylating dioxygenase [Gynuella sunshinyii YC6258]
MKTTKQWTRICKKEDLVAWSGVAALIDGQQVALIYLPGPCEQVYAISNIDPYSGAGVIARGIVGSLQGKTVIASPIYKQHFNLENGQCLEDSSIKIPVWPVQISQQHVEIGLENRMLSVNE